MRLYDLAERRQGAGEFSSPWQRWLTRARLIVHDLMKPLAVPAAGGLLSSILFFTMLVNTFALEMPAEDDIPLGVFTRSHRRYGFSLRFHRARDNRRAFDRTKTAVWLAFLPTM